MTTRRSHNDEILVRLDRIERDLATIKVELAETRGAYRLARFVLALLSLRTRRPYRVARGSG